MNHNQPITSFAQLSQVEREERLKSMSTDFGDATREMKRIDNMTSSRPVVREDVFFNVFLPYFAKTEERNYYFKDDAYTKGHEKAMMAWQHVLSGGRQGVPGTHQVVGWIYSEVDVVNANGDVVITVPPMMRFEMLDSGNHGKEDRPNVYKIVEQTNVMSRISTQHGDMYMRNALAQAGSRLINDEAIIANLNAWNKVFRHYGFPEIPMGEHADHAQTQASVEQTNTSTFNSSDFEED